MDDPAGAAVPPAPAALDLDLTEGAGALVGQRRLPTTVGLALGGAFVAVGLFELAILPHPGVTAELVIAGLLVALGAALLVLSVRSGFLNPVVRLHADPGAVRFERRHGPPRHLKTAHPTFAIDLEDLSPDPASRPEEKAFVFFAAPGPVYGNLPPDAVGALLDWARGSGLSIRMRTRTLAGRTPHRVRRIRIRPAGGDEGS